MKTRFILIFSGIVFLSVIINSCGNADNDNLDSVSETPPAYNETDNINNVTTEEVKLDTLPEFDFNGADFTILYGTNTAQPMLTMEISVESANGDVVNDAIYNRNIDIESRFNVNIISTTHGNASVTSNDVRKSVASGEYFANVVNNSASALPTIVLEGLCVNLYDIDYIDFTKPWWNESAVQNLTFGNNQAYFMAGSFNLSSMQNTYGIFFNKDLLTRSGVISPDSVYDLVTEGKWTIDKMIEITNDLYIDLNGDSIADENDQFGIIVIPGAPISTYQYAFGFTAHTRDAENYPSLDLNQELMSGIIEKVYKLYFENTGSYYRIGDSNHPNLMNHFAKGNAGFAMNFIGNASLLRDFDSEYGIIPVPKYNESQEKYHTISGVSASVSAVPITVEAENLEMTGVILEALNMYSYNDVVPAFYEIALKVKYARDNATFQILDDIYSNVIYDSGIIYNGTNGFGFFARDMIEAGNNNFVSYYESKISAANEYLKTIIDFYKKLAG